MARRRLGRIAGALAGVLAVVTGCTGDGGASAGVTALYDTSPTRSDFFAAPWPSDARTKQDAAGAVHLDLDGFYDPGAIVGQYLGWFEADATPGFGTQSGAFFRFDGPIDPATLPADAAGSVDPAASVFLVDVTAASPEYGMRRPVRVSFAHDGGLFIGPDHLVLLPEPGFPLREKTTYAAVVTDGVKDESGHAVLRDARFQLPSMSLPSTVDASHVVSIAVFTTRDATSVMKALRDAVYAQLPEPPAPAGLHYVGSDKAKTYDHYEGTYPGPNFQEGDPPYLKTGGAIHLGAGGTPEIVRMESLRFAVTVPRGPMPAAGWPVVLYAHGTGGSYTSFIADGSAGNAALVQDGDGKTLAQLAMISIDQVLHGPRDPTMSDPDITFYNFQNLPAARDNIKQGALDDFSLVRLVEGFSVAAADQTGAPIRFDPGRIYFEGHSQGGSTGPLFLSFEPKVKAAILSGAGADLIFALLGKTQPDDIPALVAALVDEPVDEFHPLLSLLQTYLESADPGNHARYFFREPPSDMGGVAPKSIYQSLGIVDHYTPIPTIKALALAMGVQPVDPQLEPIAALPLTGMSWGTAPVMANVAGGRATGVLCEYQVPLVKGVQAYDGHFVVFDHPDAIRQSSAFLGTHAKTGTATLIP